jgi:hypothetical protein
MKEDKKNTRPEAYPKPSETDQQLQNQPEYIDQEPNTMEKEISDIPADKTRPSEDNIQTSTD